MKALKHIAFLVVVLAFFIECAVTDGTGPGPTTFKAHFLTPEGDPYPFDTVILSDGVSVQEFNNVTYIEADVPNDFFFTATYHVGSHYNTHECEFALEPGDSIELEFYAVDPNMVIGRERPYLVGKEVNAVVDLQWEYSADDVLTYTVETEPANQFVLVSTWIQAFTDYDSSGTKVHTGYTGQSIQSNEWYVDVWYGPFGVDFNFGTQTWYDSTEFSIAGGHGNGGIGGDDYPRIEMEFSQIEPDLVPVGIRKILDNHARVKIFDIALRDLDGGLQELQYLYPQWAVFPDSTYIFELNNLSAGYAALGLPLYTYTGLMIIFDMYPPEIASLEPGGFYIVAENFYADSSYSNLRYVPGESMTVDVATEIGGHDYWGCFVLPDTYTVGSLNAYPDGGELQERYDYTINTGVEGYNLVVVRITPDYDRLELIFQDALLAE